MHETVLSFLFSNSDNLFCFLETISLLLFLVGWLALDPAGVKRFVYISAADFGLVNYLLQGYYEGKVLLSDLEINPGFWALKHCLKRYLSL
jgi:hypothetical protein